MNYGLLLTFPLSFDANEVDAIIHEEAAIQAAELEGPNSPNYDAICERIEEQLWDQYWIKTSIAEAKNRQKLAKV